MHAKINKLFELVVTVHTRFALPKYIISCKRYVQKHAYINKLGYLYLILVHAPMITKAHEYVARSRGQLYDLDKSWPP